MLVGVTIGTPSALHCECGRGRDKARVRIRVGVTGPVLGVGPHHGVMAGAARLVGDADAHVRRHGRTRRFPVGNGGDHGLGFLRPLCYRLEWFVRGVLSHLLVSGYGMGVQSLGIVVGVSDVAYGCPGALSGRL